MGKKDVSKERRVIVDTNILSFYLQNRVEVVNEFRLLTAENIKVPAIAAMEILRKATSKAELQSLQTFLRSYELLHVTELISSRTMQLIVEYQVSKKLPILDAMHAAFALSYNCELWTDNLKDVDYIKGLKLYPLKINRERQK